MSVATLVEAITRRVKARQVEKVATAFSQYKQEVLIPAAADKDVDIDTLEILLEANERRPEDFAPDLEKYKSRVTDRATMDRIPVLQTQQRTTEAQRDKLLAELQATMDRLNPQIRQCVEQLRGIEAQLAACSGSEGRLLASVMDPGLLARQAEINERRQEVSSRLRAATERRDDAQKRHRYLQVFIEGEGAPGVSAKAIQEARDNLAPSAAALKERQSEVAAIAAEMQKVERDQAQLHSEMLVP